MASSWSLSSIYIHCHSEDWVMVTICIYCSTASSPSVQEVSRGQHRHTKIIIIGIIILTITNISQFGATKYWKSGGVGKSVKVSVQETRTWCNLAMWGHRQSQHCHVLFMIISDSCFEILKHWIEEKTSDHKTFFDTWSENLQISTTFCVCSWSSLTPQWYNVLSGHRREDLHHHHIHSCHCPHGSNHGRCRDCFLPRRSDWEHLDGSDQKAM